MSLSIMSSWLSPVPYSASFLLPVTRRGLERAQDSRQAPSERWMDAEWRSSGRHSVEVLRGPVCQTSSDCLNTLLGVQLGI